MGAGGSGDHQPYGGDSLVGVCAALAAVQIIFVVARFYTRFMQRMKLGVDDYLILVALISSLARSALYIVLAKIGGIGYHFEYISQKPDTMLFMRKCIVALQVLDYPFTVTPAKMALLLFYLRIFPTRKFRILVYTVGSLVLAVGLSTLLENFFQCRPFAYTWDRSIPGGRCTSRLKAYRIFSPLNVFTGILILIMPIPAVWKLHAPRGQKLALTGVFLLGGLGTLASILRMAIYFAEADIVMDDPTWFSVKLGILTIVEGGMLIIAACLVTIWPLFTQIMPRRFQATFSRHTRHKSQHRCWYQRRVSPQSQSKEDIAPCRERRSPREEEWSSSPSLPCSLADLEDQRWSILVDESVPSSHHGSAVLTPK